MAKLETRDMLHLAQLAQIELSESELERFRVEINEILTYVEQLQDADVDDLEPTTQVTGLKNVTRKDTIKQLPYDRDALLQNAPDRTKDGYIKVRRVLS